MPKHEYFAAANTADGFISYFDRIFDPSVLDDLYIIKGGPGTGKSSVLRRVAEAAEKRGYTVEYYYCSSDPSSLDGILIPKLSFGMLDGTSPHMTDPVYPGAVDTVFDIYPYLNAKLLKQRREDIKALTDKNKLLHRRSAAYRRFAGDAEREAAVLMETCIDKQKLLSAVNRAATVKGGQGISEHRQISAFSTKGKVTLQTLENMARTKIGVCDEHGSAYMFMNELKNALIKKHVPFYYSLDTLLPQRCETILIKESGEYFSITGRMADTDRKAYDRLINMKRFIKTDTLKDVRGRLRLCKKIRDTLENEAQRLIAEAGRVHDRLEAVYNGAVDFDGIRAAADRVIELRIKSVGEGSPLPH